MIDFRDDGRIAIDFEGKPITLRIPKIKETETLEEFALELDKELDEFEDVRERITDDEKRKENPVTPEELNEYQKVKERAALKWIDKAIEILGDRKPPEIDDFPTFLADISLPTRFRRHWRTVPLSSSERERRSPSATGR